MVVTIDSPFLVPFDETFSVKDYPTEPPEGENDKSRNKKLLKAAVSEFNKLQRVLYAHNRYSVLLIFQAMDAAGKDSTIRHVMTGVNPAGFQVSSFGVPSEEELDHDFLWRTTRKLPERGRIGVFNRSYYEEALVVRVHPEILAGQRVPQTLKNEDIWQQRFESFRQHEQHLARNGALILKFWLNVSKDEQRERFLSRLNEAEKWWKFSMGDVKERAQWGDYMQAYQELLNATSRPWAPWYAIPADSKPFMRRTVAEIIVAHLRQLPLSYPSISKDEAAKFDEMRKLLENE
jgi:PPK2 family polyphosphate:nucleotide phosphotransferase